jgi:RNA-directed DNA polymerase
MLYSEPVWEEWCRKIEKKNAPKTYDHFDHRFAYADRKAELKAILSGPVGVKEHAFLPLIKLEIATPRFRYLDSKGVKGLETKVRPISYASHLDTYLYSFYAFALGKRYEQYIHDHGFDACVLAYRSDLVGRCNIQFARDVFTYIREKGPCIAIALDIKGYFDHIDHRLLKEKWAEVLGVNELPPDQYNVYKSLTKYTYVKRNSFLRHYGIQLQKDPWKSCFLDRMGNGSYHEKFDRLREAKLLVQNTAHELLPDGRKRFYGIPQGLSISALLSNIYLIDYDREMQELAEREGLLYRRYCDDILIVCERRDTQNGNSWPSR